MYYLQSRYYDPVVGRFINADKPAFISSAEYLLDINLYAYCKNDCVNQKDEQGFGNIDVFLNVVSSAIGVLQHIINLIKNSFNKEFLALQKSVKLLTRKQAQTLANIKAIQKSCSGLIKKLGKVGNLVFLVSLVIMIVSSFRSGAGLARVLVDFIAEMFVFGFQALVEWGSRLLCKMIPYVGFLISVIGGWLVSYLLNKLFNSQKMKRIKNRLASLIKSTSLNLWNLLKIGFKSLTA